MPPKTSRLTAFDLNLMAVAEAGQADEIECLIAKGASARAEDNLKKTAFILAAENGHLECLKALLPHSRASKADCEGTTALGWAAMRGHVDCVAFLAGVIDPNKVDKKGATPLCEAAEAGHADCVAILAPLTDVKKQQQNGQTALMRAASGPGLAFKHWGGGEGDYVSCLRILLPLSDPVATEWNGRTALMIATQVAGQRKMLGHSEEKALKCVEMLIPVSDLAARADPEDRRAAGKTAFEIAAGFEHAKAMDLLARTADREFMALFKKEFGKGFSKAFPRWTAFVEAEQLARAAGISSATAEKQTNSKKSRGSPADESNVPTAAAGNGSRKNRL